jgi:hypothetical protein
VARLLQNPIHSKLGTYQRCSQFAAPAGTLGGLAAMSRVAALSIEFVAKPHETQRLQTALPAALDGILNQVAGFGGALVFIANHEARLVTVVTLWTGEDRMRQCSENLKWVRSLLNPYLDRCLRVQTLAAFTPSAEGGSRKSPNEPETNRLTATEKPAAEEQDVAACAA